MRVLISLSLLFFVNNSYAFDFQAFKEKLRGPITKYLGEDSATKLLGKSANSLVSTSIKMPTIPKLQAKATDASVYKKDGAIFKTGERFNNLSLEDKRVYRVAFIKELFVATRNTEAKEEDIVTFLNVIEQGGSREGVYRRLTSDDLYRSLEGFSDVPSDKLINFVVEYAGKYMNIGYEAESMKKVNLYSIKRIVAEKTLELIDVLAKKPKELYSWYGLLSSELAQKGAGVYQSKIRKVVVPENHYKWAKTVPFQHIKSEVVIKLHLLMNALNDQE